MTKLLLCLSLAGGLAACVAPEPPAPARSSTPPSARPTASGAVFDDAPLPNRKVTPGSDSIIRMAH